MALTTRYGFADSPLANAGDPSQGFSTLSASLSAIAVTAAITSVSDFPSVVEFDVIIGLRGSTGTWTNVERAHCTSVSGSTFTLTRPNPVAHAAGERISNGLTEEGLAQNPGVRTDTGDLQYLAATGRMARLAAGADRAFLVYASGVPVVRAIQAADLPDLSATYLTAAAAAAAYQPIGSYAAASHTHTASQVTDLATAAVAFTNKTGNISQWTNDSGYTTAAAVAAAYIAGPGPVVANAIPRMSGTGGYTLQGYTSGAPTISDTGAITLAPPAGTTAYPLTVDVSAMDADAPLFTHGFGVFDVNGADPRNNVVSFLGWNMSANGGRLDTGDVSQGLSFESYYVNGGVAGSEFHISATDLSGNEHRAFSSFMPRDGGLGSIIYLHADRIEMQTYAGVAKVQFNFADGLITTTGVTWQYPNNVQFAKQYNAAGSSSLTLPFYDNEDRLRLPAASVHIGTTPTTGTYANTFAVFQATALPVNGALLAGIMPAVAGDATSFSFDGSFTGTNIARIYNSSNTSGAHTRLDLQTRSSGGDPFIRYNNDVVAWAVGMDTSDGGKFKWSDYIIGNGDRMVLTATGRLGVGHSTPTARVHMAAGTATASTAPLKFTSGTHLTTAEAGAMEYNGTNLFFTRSGTVREGVLTQSAVTTEVIVCDTSVTVNIGGTTYKLLARA